MAKIKIAEEICIKARKKNKTKASISDSHRICAISARSLLICEKKETSAGAHKLW